MIFTLIINLIASIFQGVNIPGLGTFTFTQKKLEVGNNKFILIQRPVFIVSEKFAMTHALTYTKHHTTGTIFYFTTKMRFYFKTHILELNLGGKPLKVNKDVALATTCYFIQKISFASRDISDCPQVAFFKVLFFFNSNFYRR